MNLQVGLELRVQDSGIRAKLRVYTPGERPTPFLEGPLRNDPYSAVLPATGRDR